MNVARPLSRALATSRTSCFCGQRSFLHSSARRRQDDADPSKKKSSPSAVGPARAREIKGERKLINVEEALPAFTEEEYQQLKAKYTPEQVEAIRAGEAAINPQDILDQGILKRGHMTIDYIDDFSKIRPVIDKQPRAPEENYDPKLRFKTEEELTADLTDWMMTVNKTKEGRDPVEWRKFEDNNRLTVGKAEAELNPPSYEAPALHKMTDPLVRSQARASRASKQDDEMAPYYQRLERITGLDQKLMKNLRYKVLLSKRVVNQTRMGKVHSQYFLVVCGNGRGLLGLGEGKTKDPEQGRRQAIMNAIRNLTPIRRYEDRTIYGDVKGKVGATELELFTRPPGIYPPLVWRRSQSS